MAADSEGSCASVTDSDEAKDRFYELVNKKGELHMFSQLVTLRVDYSHCQTGRPEAKRRMKYKLVAF